jgi:regulator of protease activity HflC (stomatin/prohibitin superfamily)
MSAVLVLLVVLGALVMLGVSLAAASVRVLREYERGVVFRFGRLVAQKGPGLVFLMPIADRMVRVTLRTITHTIPPQDVITRDNVPARVDAVAYFRVVDADASVIDIENYLQATSEIAKTTLRSVLGKAELDTLLSERERLNEDLQRIIDEQTEPWGIKVVAVEIKDVGIPQEMQRAMARQAEAERDRRAKVINAEAEFQAAARLAEAADLLSRNPAAMELRYLQTLSEVGKGEGSTVLMPLDVIGSVVRGAGDHGRGNGRGLAQLDRPS